MTDAYGHYDAADLGLPSAASRTTTEKTTTNRSDTNKIDRAVYRLLHETGHELPDGDFGDNALNQAVDKALKAYGQMRFERDNLATVVEAAYRFAGLLIATHAQDNGVAYNYDRQLRDALDHAAT